MLSHLRFHRRGPSHPSNNDSDHHHQHHHHQSAVQYGRTSADQQSFRSPLRARNSGSSNSDTATIATTSTSISNPADGKRPPSSSSASPSSSIFPPVLPPIAQVTSPIFTNEAQPNDDRQAPQAHRHVDMSFHQDSRAQSQRSPYNTLDSGFIGGVALTKYRQDLAAQAQNHQGQGAVQGQAQAQGQNGDNQHPVTSNSQRSSGSRQRPVPAPINTNLQSRPPPQQLPSQTKSQSSFSTPTDLQNATSNSLGRRPAGMRLASEPPMMSSVSSVQEPHKGKKGLPFLKNPMTTLLMRRKNSQNPSDPIPAPSTSRPPEPTPDPSIRGTRVHDFSAPRRKNPPPTRSPIPPATFSQADSPLDHREFSGTSSNNEGVLQDASPATPNHTPEVTHASEPLKSIKSFSSGDATPRRGASTTSSVYSQPSRVPSQAQNSLSNDVLQTASSTRTGQSRKVSIASGGSITGRISSIPKHMKSTSSRFSFDMVGGPAEQELIMEERHRQREAEKKINEPMNRRDSRYDEFDEDNFDYDAMMDDDGLEERIPGVNADWDEEDAFLVGEDDLDPDNDQENFAGFVFERSGGPPSLTSPEASQLTPRDENAGNNDLATPSASPALLASPMLPSTQQQTSPSLSPSGLGIQNQMLGVQDPVHQHGMTTQQQTKDDMYFDDGIMGYEDEFADELAFDPEGEPFDESIFDNDDTDQYGRPIAGAFAEAQSQRRATKEEEVRRESDLTSGLSPQSEVTQSTAHTSVSVQDHEDSVTKDSPQDLESAPNSLAADGNIMEAYQAALAAAAHEAAASGKFNRGSSPSGGTRPQAKEEESDFIEGLPMDDGNFGYENMDDFELDDDAIIAEANASALANDSDGWYGQEFGFYAAPVSQQTVASKDGVDYEYSNGGVFGPKGMNGVDRTKSGRIVCREPNLTPITERSEYSNRNSIISLAKGHMSWNTPLQSPGLAQLAMMADRGDDMSLSALMRLRNRAWGDSQASLASSKEGSPKSEWGDMSPYPWTASSNGPHNGQLGHARNSSLMSAMSQDSGWNGSISASPTMTANLSTSAAAGADHLAVLSRGNTAASAPPTMSQSERNRASDLSGSENNDNILSAVSSTSQGQSSQSTTSPTVARRPGHKHKSSAESISYTKEEESGETRWVVERRRIAESGQIESVEREIVEGGRI